MSDEFQNPWADGGDLNPQWDTNQWENQNESADWAALDVAPMSDGADAFSPPSKEFQSALAEVVKELNTFRFGAAVTPNGNLEGDKKNHDDAFWDEVYEPNAPDMKFSLKVKAGIAASEAYNAMRDATKRENWSLDCSEFVQASRLLAMLKIIGADAFNRKLGAGAIFRQHNSTGIESFIEYVRKGPAEPMVRRFNGTKVDQTADQLVRMAPIGSRIMWTNLLGISPYRNENTVKLADDSFGAHDFGTISRRELELGLARLATGKEEVEEEYLRRNIFISQVEIYKSP